MEKREREREEAQAEAHLTANTSSELASAPLQIQGKNDLDASAGRTDAVQSDETQNREVRERVTVERDRA